jgi:aspartate racemase
MKTLGIIGGLGPETTSKVYLKVIESIRKSKKEKYPAIVIYNLPFPFIIENQAIVQGINSEKMLPYLIDGAKILEKAGASFGILPCNTLHKYINEIRTSVKIPFLSIIEETALKLKSLKIKSVCILATQTTVNSEIYSGILHKAGIGVFYPNQKEQDDINKIIIQLLNSKKNNLQNQKIKAICNSLQKRGARCILLACTDLQLVIFDIKTSIPIIDTTQILIDAAVRELTTGRNYKVEI